MSDCDHKFLGTGTCAKCGRTEASILSEGYSIALRELSECGKQIADKDKRIEAMAALLDRALHVINCEASEHAGETVHESNCVGCAWEKMKKAQSNG